MNNDFTTSFLVDQTPAEAFTAINDPREWWSQNIEGSTDQLNSIFNYHYKDVHICRIKVVELVPGQKVIWHVLDNYFNFTKDKSEWKDTRIIFEIGHKDGRTEVRFTHQGLVPEYECYEVCNEAWTHYTMDSLRGLISTGHGQPTPAEAVDSFNSQLVDKWNIEQ
ncbi:MAG TPA: SRPBCC domain-containing protein [Puia sp.]